MDFTDNEITNGAECCISTNCLFCPYDDNGCLTRLHKDIFDLINRQKAEINKLTYQVNRLKKYDEERDIRLHARLTATAKAEVIKEFAERLKEKSEYIDTDEFWCDLVTTEDIDNLAKEMVGEAE